MNRVNMEFIPGEEPMSRVFVTDCEGPVSLNDNAYEAAATFIPDGDRFFRKVSEFDDILADEITARIQCRGHPETHSTLPCSLRSHG